jgi:hypothetical protein
MYIASIAVLIFLLLLVTALGRRIAVFLPDSLRETVGFYLAPLLGFSGIVLITTVYGWLSPFQNGISLLLAVGLLWISLAFEKNPEDLFRDWLIISAFAIIATLPILAPILRYDSFNPFNDTFTYLAHGQWLQNHAFSEQACSSGFFPAETQIVLYQRAGHRMGASFFLGFVQSLFHLEWSYYAYPSTVGLVFALGSLAIGGIIQQVIPVSKRVALALCLLPAFSMNGFVYGAQDGFFPQTFGLTFSAGLAVLIPSLVAYTLTSKPIWTKQFFYLIPLALCCAALLITYNDMFPVLGAGIGLFLLFVCGQNWSERNRIIGFVLIFAGQVLAVVNIEGVRIIKNFVHTLLNAASGAVHFGWPVRWLPFQFVAYSFGLKFPFNNWLDNVISIWVFPLVLILIVVILAQILHKRSSNLHILFLLCINLVFWMVFLKFRYATVGIDGEIGNTFLQFKLAKWLSPFNLALMGIVLAWLFVHTVKYKRIIKYSFFFIFLAGMLTQYTDVSRNFMQQLREKMQQKRSTFNVFLDLRSRVATIPKDQVIYLGIPQEHHKITQMVAYILSDRKLAGKYEDGYLRGSLPENERDMRTEIADWMIQWKPLQKPDENPLNRIGPFFIRHAPFAFYNLKEMKGAYNTETVDTKTWNWVKDCVEYRFDHIGKIPTSKVKFQFCLSGKPRTLTLEVNTYSGKKISSFAIPMNGGWGEYESPVLKSNSEDIVIRLLADGEPVRLSDSDSRKTKFLIQNLSLESGS